jgi:cell division protein FtsB
MHVPPAARRWAGRVGLALVVAIGIGYLPAQLIKRDPRAVKLDDQLAKLRNDADDLAAKNAALVHEIHALETEVGAIEDRARTDLGMVYPDEIVVRVQPAAEAP